MFKTRILFLLTAAWLASGCGQSNADSNAAHTTPPPSPKPLHTQNTKSSSMIDHLSHAVTSATTTAKSITGTITHKAASTLNEAKKSADSVVESVQNKAMEAVNTAKNKLGSLGAESKKEPVKEKTLFDRISDAVHHAEDTTQSIGTTAKVINTARHALKPILK